MGTDDREPPGAAARHRHLRRAIERRRNPPLRRSDITVTEENLVRRAVKAAALGNAMEWYDFGIYAYLAVTLGEVFFPSGNDTAQLLSSFAAFAVAFLVRPLGGLFFGPLGDRVGRRQILALTMILMALGTFCIGLVPGYDTIGLWAPLLLLFFRLVQGFSTGGEYGGAATFIAEYAPDKKRGFYGSFLEFGTLGGYVAAAGLVTVLELVLSDAAMTDWGWRIPFLTAGPLGVVGIYLRLRLEETPAFRKEVEKRATGPETAGDEPPTSESLPKQTLKRIFAEQWRMLLLCVGLVAAYNITNYMLLTYMPTYLTDQMGYDEAHGLLVLLGTMVVMMAVINQVGRLNDRHGRKPLLMAGMLGYLLFSLPAILLVKQGSLGAVIAGMGLLGLSLVCLLGTMSASLPAMFPTHVRYGSLAIAYNVSASLFGGTTPLVITALIDWSGSDLMPAYYTMAAALVGVVAVSLMKETARKPLEGSPPSVATHEEARRLAAGRHDRNPPY
ncbi:glycine betaine/L-proline transporter ProP [Streptomyces megasporus]|uniref:glycine betaine/L-proline transporter ProP n=1 Tax=Streptomyces megasporus TaxID=44060 RepID=UPI00068F8BAB|nr:glycine betaine/L-proline transporter ProP [Streptomyces megasporus]